MRTLSKIRYLKRQNTNNEALLQKGWYDELIQHFGVDVTYFRLRTDYYDSPSGNYSNYTYGETPTSPYSTSADIVVYMNVSDDTPVLRKLGIETSQDAEIFFMKERFTEELRDVIGTPTTGLMNSIVEANISGFSGLLSGELVNSDISGFTSAWTTIPSGVVSANYVGDFNRYPKPLNALLKQSTMYTDRVVDGLVSGVVSGQVDISGNGYVSGGVSGELRYFTPIATNGAPHWNIAPQVGDFIRLKEFDEDENVFYEYEITEVLDRDLTPAGLNPHLYKYLWRCTIVRRDSSAEDVVGSTQEESTTPNYLNSNAWNEIISDDEIFDYKNPIDKIDDKPNADNVYGGYSS